MEEAAASNFSMIHYLERFGGYRAFKELGRLRASSMLLSIRTWRRQETTLPC